MKYRTDFVTNSSSSSFAAAAVTTLAGILAGFNCTSVDAPEGEENEGQQADDPVFMQKTTMPSDDLKLVAGGEPVYLYAQLCMVTEEDTVVLDEPTASISYNISTGSGWAQVSPVELVGGWAAVEVLGITPESAALAPQKIVIKATCKLNKKTYKATFRLPYEAEASLEVKPNECHFLTKTQASKAFTVTVKNPGIDPWVLESEPDSWAEKISSSELQDISDAGDKATLAVTENDTEEITGRGTQYYSRGKITVTARNGDKEVSDYCNIYVWREGLFFVENGCLDMDRETGDIVIKADTEPDGQMKSALFDLMYLRWDAEKEQAVCDTAAFADDSVFSFDEPDPKDANAEAVFETMDAPIEFLEVRPSNMPSGKFKIAMTKTIPGKRGDRYRFTVTANIDDGVDYFSVDIPFAIEPAYLSETSTNWQKEYDYCKKIITQFLPPSRRDAKLLELENCKHYMGVEDLRRYRKETWDVCYDIIMTKKADYEAEAAWYDNALYVAEWVQWLNDRAFNVVLGTLTGPLGTFVVNQSKELLQDLIAKYVEAKATDTWMGICYDVLYNRFSSSLGGAVDANYFGDPEVSRSWIISFFVYKFAFHWAFDYENNERKGCLAGLQAACWDLAGTGLEEKLKPFIGDMAKKGNFQKSMAIDDYITKTVENVKPYIARLMASSFVTDERGSG